ncbi:2-(acetamidomethylene)succinate hydrolase [Thermoflexales bacterium]|nr:2-(acetamidomethylene)succinate hydrolase [Thermoflexales bacterium]
MDTSPHHSDFVNVNGIRLHYLDWGGGGPALLFLAGLGSTAHIFDRFAPRFIDKFHVLALTRRGHGESDYPETGYDIATLTEDIRQFMDVLKIDQAILVGHSLAGIELSHLAAAYPERVLKVVFLDAAYDRASPAFKAIRAKDPMYNIQRPGEYADHYTLEDYTAAIKRGYPSLAAIWSEVLDTEVERSVKRTLEGKVVDKMSEAIGQAIRATIDSYVPEDAKIQVPVLSFFALPDSAYYLSADFMSEEQQAQVIEFFDTTLNSYNRKAIEQFRRNVPHARIVEIPKGHHYCFIKQEELVFNEMQSFLLG